MRLAFFLGTAPPIINGGTIVILEHASRLAGMGLEVFLVTEERVDPTDYQWHKGAASCEFLSLDEAKKEHFDMAVATWWRSVYLLHHVTAERYVYFVQSIESRFFEPWGPDRPQEPPFNPVADLCADTYFCNIPVITEARWIQRYLSEFYNAFSLPAPNGINKELFREDGPCAADREPGRLRVLVEGPLHVPYKNVERSIALARDAGVDEVWLLSSSEVEEVAGVDRVFSGLPPAKVPPVYRSCDLLLKLSYVEGMFGPPLEMFHCGGTALVYDVTGHDEYIVHGQNALVADSGDEEQVVAFLQRLRQDHELLGRLKKNALATAASWPGWDQATAAFHRAMEKIRQTTPPVSRNYLRRFSDRMLTAHHHANLFQESSSVMDREKDGAKDAGSAELQVFWSADGIFCEEDATVMLYQPDGWRTLTIPLPAAGPLLYLRLDPSRRPGCVLIKELVLFAGTREAAAFRSSRDFARCTAGGTAKITACSPFLALASHGSDPFVVLPRLSVPSGAPLRLRLTLCETSFTRAMEMLS